MALPKFFENAKKTRTKESIEAKPKIYNLNKLNRDVPVFIRGEGGL